MGLQPGPAAQATLVKMCRVGLRRSPVRFWLLSVHPRPHLGRDGRWAKCPFPMWNLVKAPSTPAANNSKQLFFEAARRRGEAFRWGCALFLASDAASFISGAHVVVDGGAMAVGA